MVTGREIVSFGFRLNGPVSFFLQNVQWSVYQILVNDNQLQGKLMSGDAKNIVSDLLVALEMMNSEDFFQAGVVPDLVDQGICSTCCKRHLDDLRTSLATVHAALVPTRQLMLNDTGKNSNWNIRHSTVTGI